jgi:hypothetical protein
LDLSLFLNVLSRKNIKKNLAIGLFVKLVRDELFDRRLDLMRLSGLSRSIECLFSNDFFDGCILSLE